MHVPVAERTNQQQHQTIIELQAEIARLNYEVITPQVPFSLLITMRLANEGQMKMHLP